MIYPGAYHCIGFFLMRRRYFVIFTYDMQQALSICSSYVILRLKIINDLSFFWGFNDTFKLIGVNNFKCITSRSSHIFIWCKLLDLLNFLTLHGLSLLFIWSLLSLCLASISLISWFNYLNSAFGPSMCNMCKLTFCFFWIKFD